MHACIDECAVRAAAVHRRAALAALTLALCLARVATPELLGRVVDALGSPIDGAGPINTKERRRVEFKARSDFHAEAARQRVCAFSSLCTSCGRQ